ncbi:MAG: hypothetical protein QGG39_17470, partial [Candidatus Poribacteria bacterium]|nr:hypothetical protein [Candidatus Poribacteria bacterium]
PGYFGQKRKSARLTGLQMQVRWLQFFYPRFWHQSINGVKTLHRCFVLHTGEGQFALPLAQWFDLSAATTYQWMGLTAETVGEPVVAAGIEEIEIDHRWHFLSVKKPKDGSSRCWMVTAAELSAGLSLVVMGQG